MTQTVHVERAIGRVAVVLLELAAQEDQHSLDLLHAADAALKAGRGGDGDRAGVHVAAVLARLLAAQAARRSAALDQLAESIGASVGLVSPLG